MRSWCQVSLENRRRRRLHPHGLTLLEILVSTAILLASLTAIMQVLNVGHNSRLSAVLDAEGVLRCESMMGELLAGVRPLASSSVEPFEDNPKWMWYASISDQGSTSLLQVEVVVEHSPGSNQVNSSYSLTRYVRDPQIFQEADGGDE